MKKTYGCLVLVVDDVDDIRREVSTSLRNAGLRVHTADSGCEAMKKFETEDIHVVVTDVHMQPGDGIELLNWIKKHHSTVNVFLMSGNPLNRSVAGRESDGFFVKPFNHQDLVKAVLAACESHRESA